MTFDFDEDIAEQTAQYWDRIAKHRCVLCGDQLADDHELKICAACDVLDATDYAADQVADDPRRGQAAGLNNLRRMK